MKILFNRNNSIGTLCLLLLLAVGAVSCIKDEYAEKEKATVQVTFMTRAVSDGTIAGDELADNERMKTLRVIVAKGDKILYNEYYTEVDFAHYENGQSYKTVTFSELVTEDEADRTFDFYAIANEEGTGFNDWASISIKTLESRKIEQSFVSSSLIPQTAKKEITVEIPQKDSGIQKETMQLEFVVAKINTQITNNTGNLVLVEDVILTGAKAAGISLFPVENGTGAFTPYADLTMDNFNVASGETESKTFYVFPGSLSTITGNWGNTQTTKIPDDIISQYNRGTLLNINITLSSVAEQVTVDLEWAVADWDDDTIEVPPFN